MSIRNIIYLMLVLVTYNLISCETTAGDNRPHVVKEEEDSNRIILLLQNYIEDTINQWHVPGIAVGVVHNGKVVFLKGFGVREVGKPERVDVQTVFRIASLSKGFAATLAGILVQDGILNYKDFVVEHLRDLKLKPSDHFNKLTIAHLLSNSTGFPSHTYTHLLDQNVPYAKIIKELKAVSPQCNPGKCYGYQNVIFSLIANIITTASGQQYSDLMKDRLFKPLGMHQASLGCAELLATQNKAIPHKLINNTYHPVAANCRYYSVLPAAGVNASVSDMAQWLKAQMHGFPAVISKATLEKIHSPLIATPQELTRFDADWRLKRLKNAYYGMGWRVMDYSGHTLIYHGGTLEGIGASIGFLPKERMGIVVLTNSSDKISSIILAKLFDLFLGLDDLDYNKLAKGRESRRNH